GAEDDGEKRPRLQVLQQDPAQRRLAGSAVAGDDDQPFAAVDRADDLLERCRVRAAAIDEPGVGREVERRLDEAVEVDVRIHRPALAGHLSCVHLRRDSSITAEVASSTVMLFRSTSTTGSPGWFWSSPSSTAAAPSPRPATAA